MAIAREGVSPRPSSPIASGPSGHRDGDSAGDALSRLSSLHVKGLEGLALRDGKVISTEGPAIPIYAPADGARIGSVIANSRADIDQMLEEARRVQPRWAETPIQERAAILQRGADLLEQHADDIAALLVREIAKNRRDARDEVLRSADLIRFTAEEGTRLAGETLFADAFPRFKRNKIGLTFRVPLGTILAIPPFNYPVNLAVSKIAPALIAGNAVMLKPPTQGSLSAYLLAAVLLDSGLPKGILQVASGRGSEIGDYLVTHPAIHMISFTGSSATGRHIAKLATMIPLIMELGGKDAAIVLSDADLDLAARDIVGGAFSYSGQRCTAVKRVLVIDSVADELVERIARLTQSLKVGMPEDDATITPLIDDAAADFVQELIDDAIAKGARLILGNQRQKNLLWPTVFDHVTTEMRLAWEEPFGPVLPIIRVSDAEEAVHIANASEYGLQSSIFSRDIDAALAVAFQLEVGTVQINGKTARGPDHFPFLGTKSSGLGTQGVAYSIEAMTRLKSVVFNLRERDSLKGIR